MDARLGDGVRAMEYRHLRYFVAVAEELNFTRAAKRLYIAQPSLGQQIRQLEEFVGTPLFHRDGHRLELTVAGRTLLHEARDILSHTQRAMDLTRRAAKAEAGLITVAMAAGPEGKIFSAVVAKLFHSHPDIQVELRTLTGPAQIAAIKKHEINIGFLRAPIETDEEIASEVVLREDIVAILPADHFLNRMELISVSELASALPLVDMSRATAPALHMTIHRIEADAGVHFRTILQTESITATLNAIACGLGFSLHGEYVKQILPMNVSVRRLDLCPVPQLELVAIYRKGDMLPALALFLSLLRSSTSFSASTSD